MVIKYFLTLRLYHVNNIQEGKITISEKATCKDSSPTITVASCDHLRPSFQYERVIRVLEITLVPFPVKHSEVLFVTWAHPNAVYFASF